MDNCKLCGVEVASGDMHRGMCMSCFEGPVDPRKKWVETELGPLPTSIGKPVIVLEIIQMLKDRVSYLNDQGMMWAKEAAVFKVVIRMIEERFLK